MKARASRKLVLLGFSVLFILAMASAAVAQPGKFVNGVLQPLEDGFPNRQLSVMVVDSPGSADSMYATLISEVLKRISPVQVLIQHREDFSNFGTWEALAWVADQGKLGNDGYITQIFTFPGCVVDLLAVDMKTEVGLDLNDLNVVVTTELTPWFIIQRANAPWGDSIQAMVDYAKKNPGTLRFVSGGAGSGLTCGFKYFANQLGFTYKEIVGGSAAQRVVSVASGEADTTISPAVNILPHYEAGKVKVLMAAGSTPAPPPWDKVPTAVSLGLQNDPWGTIRGIVVPSKVPDSHRLWLETLFSTAAKDEGFIAKRKVIPGLTPVIRNKEASIKVAKDIYDFALPIMKAEGVYWPDVKK